MEGEKITLLFLFDTIQTITLFFFLIVKIYLVYPGFYLISTIVYAETWKKQDFDRVPSVFVCLFILCFLFSYNIFFTEYNIIKRKHVRFTSLILDRSFVNIQKLESDRWCQEPYAYHRSVWYLWWINVSLRVHTTIINHSWKWS